MRCARMVPGPVAGATLVVGAILVYCVYDLGSEGQLTRMVSAPRNLTARPLLGHQAFAPDPVPSGYLDLDRPYLLPTLRAPCPLLYERPTLEDLRSRRVRPYLFGGRQRPSCKECNRGGSSRGHLETCGYIAFPGRRVCPYEDQEALLQHFLDMADGGSRWAENLLRLTPCDLWPFLRGRTLWLLGDSITQETMVAMECFFSEWFEHVEGNELGRQPPSNDTELVQQITKEGGVHPWCVPLQGGGRICHFRSNMGTDWGHNVLPLLPGLGALPTDIMVANFAVWINNDTEYEFNLRAVTDHLQQEGVRSQLPFLIWRDASVQHFSTHTGDYNNAPWPFECVPIGGSEDAIRLQPNGTLVTEDPELQVVVEGGWRNKIATPIWEGLGVPILRTWNQTVPLWSLHHDYHPNNPHPDCTHSCHPSMYQMWIYILYETLMASQQQLLQHVSQHVPL